MRKLSLILSSIVLIGIVLLLYQHNRINHLTATKEKADQKVKYFLDKQLGGYQLEVEHNFANQGYQEAFFDSLIYSLKMLRLYLKEETLTNADQQYLSNFIKENLVATARVDVAYYLQSQNLKTVSGLFRGDASTVVNKLSPLINPYAFTQCIYVDEYDIWKDREDENSEVYRIRLLKNHELRSVFLEVLPGENVRLLKVNLAEITIPKSQDSIRKINFDLYDWTKNDTINQEVFITVD